MLACARVMYLRLLLTYCGSDGMTTIGSSDHDIVDEYGKKEFPCLAKDLYHLQLITLKRTLKITRMV